MKTTLTRQAPAGGRTAALMLVAFAVLLLFAAGCGAASTSADTGAVAPQPIGGSYLGGSATGDTQAGAAFARWVLEQDPQHQYITDAAVRGDQTLGVKVQPNITKGDVQQLLTSLAQGMARNFPGKPLRVIAFYQSGDKLAEADYNPQTNQVNVQFAR